MSRLFYGIMVACSLSLCPLSIGCGGSSAPTVIEQDAAQADQEAADYEKEMEEEAKRQASEAADIK